MFTLVIVYAHDAETTCMGQSLNAYDAEKMDDEMLSEQVCLSLFECCMDMVTIINMRPPPRNPQCI